MAATAGAADQGMAGTLLDLGRAGLGGQGLKENSGKRSVMSKRSVQWLSAGLALALSGFLSAALQASVDRAPPVHGEDAAAQDDVFAQPAVLRDKVAFWRRVFAEWSQTQVAVHDMAYPGLVYELIELEGEVGESLNEAQREQIKQRREFWQARLQALAATEGDGAELSAEDRVLRQRLVEAGGPAAVSEAHARLRTQRGVRERFRRGLEISGRYDAAFRRVFKEAGLPEDLAYLPHVESSFQAHARSSAGAVGMWQFTRGAGRRFMTVDKAVDERLDPLASARGAARYLKEAYAQLGDWGLAVTSYNHGIQGMARAKAQFGADFGRILSEYQGKSFGFASRNFYAEFLAAREIAAQPERFFPEGLRFEAPLRHDHVVLERAARVHDLAAEYGVTPLNPAWGTRVGRGQTAVPAGVLVNLPAGTLMAAAAKSTALLSAATRKEDERAREASAQAQVHVVRAGESLSVIAQRYRVELASLRAMNDLAPGTDLLRVGQKLNVPGAGSAQVGEARVHVVRAGDTPWLIAVNYGVSVSQLLASNQLTKRSIIRPGQRLGIPAAR